MINHCKAIENASFSSFARNRKKQYEISGNKKHLINEDNLNLVNENSLVSSVCLLKSFDNRCFHTSTIRKYTLDVCSLDRIDNIER